MPLHGQHETVAPVELDGLDHAVGIPGAGTISPSPSSVDRLVVIALGIGRLADQRGQPGARHRRIADVLNTALPAWCRLMPTTSGRCWMQRSAQRDVEHLGTAADSENGQPAAQGAAQQGELPGVAVAGGLIGRRVRRLAVGAPGRRPGRR